MPAHIPRQLETSLPNSRDESKVTRSACGMQRRMFRPGWPQARIVRSVHDQVSRSCWLHRPGCGVPLQFRSNSANCANGQHAAPWTVQPTASGYLVVTERTIRA